jgi:hypothetical protein
MEKEFIPYEQALELAKLNFNEKCFGYYGLENELYIEISCNLDSNLTRRNFIATPTFSQAFRWFREKYNLNGILNHYPNSKLWDFSVHNLLWNGKEFLENVRKEDRILKYSTYEEAELECLKKLIQIIKNK